MTGVGLVVNFRTTSAVSPGSPTVVSRSSPFARCTAGANVSLSDGDVGYVSTGETSYLNAAVEPSMAANPRTAGADSTNLIGVWQQDRWSNGGARDVVAGSSFDGGATWGETPLPFSACASRRSRFVRASDPWVSIGPDGTAYASAVGLGPSANAVLVATSADGGRTWGHPSDVILDRTSRYQDDKPSITADPTRPGVAYVTWNRTQQPVVSHQMCSWFAMTTDGGRTWSPARQIARVLQGDAIGHQIVVDPRRHILYNVFLETLDGGDPDAAAPQANGGKGSASSRLIVFVKSLDGGRTWSTPRIIARVPALDPLVDFLYRLGYPLPAAAVDPGTGTLYVAWTGTRADQGNRPNIVLVASSTGGSSWSAPRRIDGPSGQPAFTPAIEVSSQGVVGVAFYSANQLYAANTDSDPHPPTVLVDEWFASSQDGRHFGGGVLLGGPFRYSAAPFANGYFLGDYQGLAVSGQDFHPFFVMSQSRAGKNRTNVFTTAVRPT